MKSWLEKNDIDKKNPNIKIRSLKLVILSEYQNKNIFAKGYTPYCSEEIFVIKYCAVDIYYE